MARSKKTGVHDSRIALALLDALVFLGILGTAVTLALAGIGTAKFVAIGTFIAVCFRAWLGRKRQAVREAAALPTASIEWKVNPTDRVQVEGQWTRARAPESAESDTTQGE
ncbi:MULTISPECIES: hypothetical protein [unclassified Kitasatospora]|uniref:hypothetical protein n=1 Tax=unclassified Kitasatospora TaxID=2633591 RepID=UPI000709CF5A|nr:MULTISPECIES: hypothetical protein [unclassified Kitasatospora]KQV20970.1 hypothetical protein ASC99_20945 [Kitasatospora sp. Root107]KRB60376.1 hypothetical protein ASE03_12225 [Kitasatospora sp. Root187]